MSSCVVLLYLFDVIKTHTNWLVSAALYWPNKLNSAHPLSCFSCVCWLWLTGPRAALMHISRAPHQPTRDSTTKEVSVIATVCVGVCVSVCVCHAGSLLEIAREWYCLNAKCPSRALYSIWIARLSARSTDCANTNVVVSSFATRSKWAIRYKYYRHIDDDFVCECAIGGSHLNTGRHGRVDMVLRGAPQIGFGISGWFCVRLGAFNM